MSLKFNRPLLLDQAAVNCTNEIGHPPHADNVQFDSAPCDCKTKRHNLSSHCHAFLKHVVFMVAIFAIFAILICATFATSLKVWWKGQQIQQRDEVEAAQAGADVLWKSSKTTSYRRHETGMNNSNLIHPPFER